MALCTVRAVRGVRFSSTPRPIDVAKQYALSYNGFSTLSRTIMFLFVLHGKRFGEVPSGCKYLLVTCIT
jgi:hypothetical protein